MTISSKHRFFETIHGVYFDDLDAFQVLHNARYLLYVERTIGAFWRFLGYSGNFDTRHGDQMHLVRANHFEYHRPVQGLGEVRVRVWVEKLGTSSLTFGFCVMPMDHDMDCAAGSRVLVKISPEGRRPTPWSDELRTKLAPYLVVHG